MENSSFAKNEADLLIQGSAPIEPNEKMKDVGWLPMAMSRVLGFSRFMLSFFKEQPAFAAGYLIVTLVVLVAVFAPLIAPYSPITANPADYLQPPNLRHFLGTDATGMDIFSRVIYAPRIDLTIAVLGTIVSSIIGTALGAIAGYYNEVGGIRGAVASVIMRSADVIQAFPVFVFAIALVAIFGQSIRSIIFSIAFVTIPIYLRLMRSEVISVRTMRYIEASVATGISDLSIIVRHILPNSMSSVLANLSINVGWAILLTAALSFVGAGIRAPIPEWGSMIAMGFQHVTTGQWWPSVFPGVALAMTVLGFSLIGASIEYLSDPIKRRAVKARHITFEEE